MSDVDIKSPLRRTQRTRKSTLKAAEYQENRKIKEKPTPESEDEISSNSSLNENELLIDTVSSSSTTLAGKNIFGFDKVKKHERILNESPEKLAIKISVPKTPHHIRKKIVKGIKTSIQADFSSEEDPFLDSGSEYAESDDSSSSSNDTEASSEDTNAAARQSPRKLLKTNKNIEDSDSEVEHNVKKKVKSIKYDEDSDSDCNVKKKLKSIKFVEDSDSDCNVKKKVKSNKNIIKESDGESSSSEDERNVRKSPRKLVKSIKYQTNTQKANNNKKHEYVIKTEEYFSNNALKKAKTSNHTLEKLTTPRLSQEQLQSLLSNMKISSEHQNAIYRFSENGKTNFNKWLCLLHENFNILLYGLGSKKNILQQFHKEALDNQPVIIINGFFPSLTLKDILDGILLDVLNLHENTSNVFDACDLIANEFEQVPNQHLYIILHNIEGDMLRNNKSQSVLAQLSSIRNIHLITSIDHINAPLIWDHNKLSKFNFIWWDVTSYLPYTDETSFESSMMVQRTGNLALSSLRNVFLSLTSNSKGIYLKILKYQLENNVNQYYQGLLFKDLYSACREAFLVSSDLALRAQLTEFRDHKMVKLSRSADGAEYLLIPIATNLLQQFLNEQNK